MNYRMNLRTKQLKGMILIILIAGIVSLWILTTYNHLKRENDLCENGVHTSGYIYQVEDNSTNEANIHSWDVLYYFDTDSTRVTGKINEPKDKRINVGDSINITYFKNNPSNHNATLGVAKTECGDYTFFSFITKNWLLLTIGFVCISLLSWKLIN